MKRSVVAVTVFIVLASPALASEAERTPKGPVQAKGVVQSKDVVVLEDGTRISLPDNGGTKARLREGVTVKLTYEERDGKHVVTSIETGEYLD